MGLRARGDCSASEIAVSAANTSSEVVLLPNLCNMLRNRISVGRGTDVSDYQQKFIP